MKRIFVLSVVTLLLLQAFSINTPNNGKDKYTIKVNKSFKYSLKSNPSTGYSWQWVNKSECAILDTFGTKYKSDCKEPMPGCGGTEIWNFKGLKKGTATVQLKYSRSFDPNSDATIKTIVVRVI